MARDLQGREASVSKGLLWLAGAGGLGLVVMFALPIAARHVPFSIEKSLFGRFGGYPASEICLTSSEPGPLRDLLKRIFPVYPDDGNFGVTVTIVKKKDINAFAAPGGRIYVFDGLLEQADSPEELEGVLAHEIEHVKRRHVAEGALERFFVKYSLAVAFGKLGLKTGPGAASVFMNLKFSRVQEDEADRGALKRLSDAGVDVAGFEHFFEKMAAKPAVPVLLSDHPGNPERMKLAEMYLHRGHRPVLNRDVWLRLKGACRR